MVKRKINKKKRKKNLKEVTVISGNLRQKVCWAIQASFKIQSTHIEEVTRHRSLKSNIFKQVKNSKMDFLDTNKLLRQQVHFLHLKERKINKNLQMGKKV